jgi:hypothetical protein
VLTGLGGSAIDLVCDVTSFGGPSTALRSTPSQSSGCSSPSAFSPFGTHVAAPSPLRSIGAHPLLLSLLLSLLLMSSRLLLSLG